MKETRKYTVTGLVQGIGYRPFTAELARSLGVTGKVQNTAGIVTIYATGIPELLDQFAALLEAQKPAGARVDQVFFVSQNLQEFDSFTIEASELEVSELEASEIKASQAGSNADYRIPDIPADLPTCPTCLTELNDKADRRYRHPFISCTACGPRYSIIEKLPYDRCNITMSDFSMCEACESEYQMLGNRRRHAQTIACHSCGPKLLMKQLQPAEGMAASAYAAAVMLLQAGGILAVKDIGGFHLACLPTAQNAVRMLRRLKGREKKPFAVMFADEQQARHYCSMNELEQQVLTSNPRPIVLLGKTTNVQAEAFVTEVCGNSPDIGAILPCNPLQTMLAEACGPLVMTSANRSGEPMLIDNQSMEAWLMEGRGFGAEGRGSLADEEIPLGMLFHDRRILSPLDDSIFRVIKGRVQVIRRARGIVPEPVLLPQEKDAPLFAAGGDLKSCFCYVEQDRAYLSQHFGDLEDEAVGRVYQQEARRMRTLFGFRPERFAVDLHPAYVSVGMTRRLCQAVAQKESEIHRIQHHHAHIASVIAEHHLSGAVLGVAFDGTGYGSDGTVWGSEFLLCQERQMERKAHLKSVRLPGGNEGAKNADSILYGYLASFSESFDVQRLVQFPWIEAEKLDLIRAAVQHNVHMVTSSSMGRLFDAVSALLNICHYNSYEGEAAIELEYMATASQQPYPLKITVGKRAENESFIGDTEMLFSELIDGLSIGISPADLAKGFLMAVSQFIVEVCDLFDVKQIALSGGTFLNRILLESVIEQLEEKRYQVYINEKVPTGDGGICLGQAYLG